MTLSTVSKTCKFVLGTEYKNEEDISPLYQTVQFLSGISTMVTHPEPSHEGLKYHCQGCDFETNWKNNLSAHYDSIHLERLSFGVFLIPYHAVEGVAC